MSSSYQRKAPWERTNKYWCQYCRIYVFDNNRQQHESGAKHKDNVQKYLRQIGKDTEAKQRAEDQLNDQFAKIEEAAARSYKKDIGTAADNISPVETVPAPRGRPYQENAASKSQEAPDQETETEEQVDTQTNTDRPTDIGVVGAWQIIEETDSSDPDDEENAKDNPMSANAQASNTDTTLASEPQDTAALRGAEWLDEEDQHPPTQLNEFDIKEKTIETKVDLLDASNSDTKVVFKKRRAPANRSTRKQRKV
ncbi:hypothetical protein H4R20_000449 [Coemansia guatemalensis]|uniref:Matrin-type domain-containing protein n=1 Tax=Coemansia guatemalensis TaxID=2761395 RepID=A0A9W8I678_9FUNG|nr:hypothetical protein H4R20_000449 [Coemansia guatemalensis]